jgi:hypothetical protein
MDMYQTLMSAGSVQAALIIEYMARQRFEEICVNTLL